MDWDAIGALGEVLGAVAVFITLIYLAIQIRQNTRSMAAATYEAAMGGFSDLTRDMSMNGELAAIARRGALDPGCLNDEERYRFNFAIRTYTHQVYKLLRLREQGVLPEREWAYIIREAAQVFAIPGYADFKSKDKRFADLWAEIDRQPIETISAFELGQEHSIER